MDNSSPLVSVILPFFNPGQGLADAINSILNQTYTNWELLLVNNNSDNHSSKVAEQFAEQDHRIYHFSESIQGIAFALNKGLELAKSQYIARMDADDISMPTRLEKQIRFLEENNDIDVVSTQTLHYSKLTKSEGYKLFVDWQNQIISPEEHYINRFVESPIAHPTVVFRKKVIDLYGNYSVMDLPEDYELWLRWMEKGVRFYKLPQPLMQWNDHLSRLSRIHMNYSREAFYRVKCFYLGKWILESLPKHKEIVICGTSKNIQKRAALLEKNGVTIFGYTDVKSRPNKKLNFIPYKHLTNPEEWFIINFISKRGVGEAIRNHFTNLDFTEGKDFILAG